MNFFNTMSKDCFKFKYCKVKKLLGNTLEFAHNLHANDLITLDLTYSY